MNKSDVIQDVTEFCVESPLLKLTFTMKVRAIAYIRTYIRSWHIRSGDIVTLMSS